MVESSEVITSGATAHDAQWSAFLTSDGGSFYIRAPNTTSPTGKQSLLSLLEIAESLGCTTAWMLVDRQRFDFVSVVSAFKFLGFQLSQSVFKDTGSNKIHALLRYELE
uniref:Ornithine decarboxylase antizyme n=1 Tax=Hemiselmis andersenii TaxID=464988 RepID=A0A6U4VI81_HEMAN|mmetsp:Transcript_254/g.575  ORF Transcript_254/g.575 Transcript_254/m.575 type:complete len:109 (+) Transcript_254:341-667(+)